MTPQANGPSRRWTLVAAGSSLGAFLIGLGAGEGIGPTNLLGQQSLETPPDNIPRPAYIPDGYKFRKLITTPANGFRMPGEVQLLYSLDDDPNVHLNYPLSIFFVSSSAGPGKIGATTGDSRPVQVRMSSGQLVLASYFDSTWVLDPNGDRQIQVPGAHGLEIRDLAKDFSNMHTLVLSVSTYTIAVRGSRQRGITLDELTRVAASLTI